MIKFLKSEWLMLLILLAVLVSAFIIYPKMPDMVPIHWNVHGEVDNYASKEFGTFFLPILNIAMYVLFLVLPKVDPKRANYEKFAGSYKFIRYAIHIFMMLIFILTSLVSLGYTADIGLWVTAGVSVLFILLGNVMGRVRHNYFVGFKFPWTLANEEVWRKTHQVGSKAMVLGGVVALVGAFLTEGNTRFTLLMICIFIPTIAVTVYSYILYKRITA